MNFDLVKYLTTISLVYVYARLVLHYGPFLLNYMLDQGMYWKPKFEKPRLLFLVLGLGLMHLMVYSWYNIKTDSYFLLGINLSVFSLGFYLSNIPWTENFKNSFGGQKSLNSSKKTTNFNLTISDDQLQRLYQDLMRYDLLNSEKTSLQDFKNVLLKDWSEHDSRLHLKMDGPSCREFYDHLVETFPNNSATLKNFFETSRVIVRANGKPYKYNTVKNAPTRTPVSKHYETLINIFDKLK